MTPTPGSDAAVALDCTCPVLDNGYYVRGHWKKGEPVFWIDAKCPVHAPQPPTPITDRDPGDEQP